MKISDINLSGKRILVTGGTGFIGGRLVERLVLECNAKVRVLVRNFARAVRIARFPIEMIHGDLTKSDDVKRAIKGSEVVFHCAYGNSGSEDMQREVDIEGTKNILSAALSAGVKRVVYVSTFRVYTVNSDGDIDETAPQSYCGGLYIDNKIDAQRIVFDYGAKHGLPVTVIQPTAVYGPFAPVWAINVIENLKKGRIILVNGGEGFRNVVYIDDVVSALLLAAVKENAVGEAFLISSEQPVTWREFYQRFERMLGIKGTVSMSAAEAEAYYKKRKPKVKGVIQETLSIMCEDTLIRRRILRTRELSVLRKMGHLLLPNSIKQAVKSQIKTNNVDNLPGTSLEGEKHILPIPMDPVTIRFNAAKVRVRIDKAKEILGYQPIFDIDSGMRLTEQWARWANLLH